MSHQPNMRPPARRTGRPNGRGWATVQVRRSSRNQPAPVALSLSRPGPGRARMRRRMRAMNWRQLRSARLSAGAARLCFHVRVSRNAFRIATMVSVLLRCPTATRVSQAEAERPSRLRTAMRPVDSGSMSVGDTEDGARAAQIAALQRLGPSGRVRLAAEMSEDARRIAFEGERRRHPELSPAEARRSVLERLWGEALAAKVAIAPRTR